MMHTLVITANELKKMSTSNLERALLALKEPMFKTIVSLYPSLLTNKLIVTLKKQSLSDNNESVREATAKVLGHCVGTKPLFAPETLITTVIKELENNDPKVRLTAALALRDYIVSNPRLITEKFIITLIKKLSDDDPSVVDALTRVFKQCIQTQPVFTTEIFSTVLVQELDDNSQKVRIAATKTIQHCVTSIESSLATDKLLSTLVQKLKNIDGIELEATLQVIKVCVKANLLLNTQKLITILIKKLEDNDKRTRLAAASTLTSFIKDEKKLFTKETLRILTQTLNNNNEYAQKTAENILQHIQTHFLFSVEKLIRLLVQESRGKFSLDRFKEVVQSTQYCFRTNPWLAADELFKTIVKKTDDKDINVVYTAFISLKYLVGAQPWFITKELVNMLIQKLNNNNWIIRDSAKRTLWCCTYSKPSLLATEKMLSVLVQKLKNISGNGFKDILLVIRECLYENSSLVTEELISIVIQEGYLDSQISTTSTQVLVICAEKNISIFTEKHITSLIQTEFLHSLLLSFKLLSSTAATFFESIIIANPSLATEKLTSILIQNLSDNEPDIRSTSAKLLERCIITKPLLASETVIVALSQKLSDSEKAVRDAIAGALRISMTAIPINITSKLSDKQTYASYTTYDIALYELHFVQQLSLIIAELNCRTIKINEKTKDNDTILKETFKVRSHDYLKRVLIAHLSGKIKIPTTAFIELAEFTLRKTKNVLQLTGEHHKILVSKLLQCADEMGLDRFSLVFMQLISEISIKKFKQFINEDKSLFEQIEKTYSKFHSTKQQTDEYKCHLFVLNHFFLHELNLGSITSPLDSELTTYFSVLPAPISEELDNSDNSKTTEKNKRTKRKISEIQVSNIDKTNNNGIFRKKNKWVKGTSSSFSETNNSSLDRSDSDEEQATPKNRF